MYVFCEFRTRCNVILFFFNLPMVIFILNLIGFVGCMYVYIYDYYFEFDWIYFIVWMYVSITHAHNNNYFILCFFDVDIGLGGICK